MIIGITGRKQHGKDTVADKLVRDHGYEKISFADPIREAVAAILGLDVDDLRDAATKDRIYFGKSLRYWMQTLGTEWGRAMIHENIWVDTAMQRITDHAVFPDVRFLNEARAIQQAEGLIVRVVKLDRDGKEIVDDDPHASEQGIPQHMIGTTIYAREGDIAKLHVAIEQILEDWPRVSDAY